MKKIFLALGAVLIIAATASGYIMLTAGGEVMSGFYQKKGMALEEDKKFEKAEQAYLRALEKNAEQIQARLGLNRIYRSQKNYEMAEQILQTGIQISPDIPELYISLSQTYVEQQKFYEAAELLNNIKSDYVRMKLGGLRPEPPELVPAPGRYTRKLEVQVQGTDGCTCYYMIGDDNKMESFSHSISIGRGRTAVKAVSVSEDGLVSDITVGDYNLERIVEKVEFIDPGVEEMAKYALGNVEGELTTDMLWNIKQLSNKTDTGDIITTQIHSLEDLEYFTGLQSLSLYEIEQNIPFETIPQEIMIKELTVAQHTITEQELFSIAQMDTLQSLCLTEAGLNTLEGISFPQDLVALNLSDNLLTDISPLLKMDKLQELNVSHNQLKEMPALRTITDLNISYNQIENIAFASDMNMLTKLDISNNKINNLQPIKGLSGLSSLRCSNNQLLDLSAIQGLENLEELEAAQTGIETLDALKNMQKLKRLDISANRVKDISPLSGNAYLMELQLKNNQITDISVLRKFENLKIIDVCQNPIVDYSPLGECEQLRTVFSDHETLALEEGDIQQTEGTKDSKDNNKVETNR